MVLAEYIFFSLWISKSNFIRVHLIRLPHTLSIMLLVNFITLGLNVSDFWKRIRLFEIEESTRLIRKGQWE